MAKLRVTFDVDTILLFDMLKAMGGNASAVGCRVIGTMLIGAASFDHVVGMEVYGISLHSVTPIADESAPQPPQELSP